MITGLRGKLLFAALVGTAFAKAAISFPILPAPSAVDFKTNLVIRANAKTASPEALPAPTEQPPIVVPGLTDAARQCNVPEEVLQSLTQERALLDDQNHALNARESEVNLAREKLNIEKSALLELKGSIEDLLQRIDQQQTADLQRLVALYQNMKPIEAATIMNDIDIEVLIMVLGEMKPRAAAPIMAKMTPVRARAVSKIILERSKLPGDQKLNGVRLN